MKKILFGITGLTIGGAERVLVDIANRLSKEYDITIFTLYGNGKLEKELNSDVKLINYYKNSFNEISGIKRKLISLKLFISSIIPNGYDTYVAFLEGPMTRQIAKVKSENKIAWVHNDISKVFGSGFKAKIKRKFDKNIYKKFNKIVFVSEENLEDFKKTYGNNFDTVVIKNFLDSAKVVEKSNKKSKKVEIFNNDVPKLVSVCRLVEQKGIDRFIRVHKELIDGGIKNEVYIVGDGPLRESLEEQIKRDGVQNTFKLLGEKDNPYTYTKMADYFCLLSNFEGYGMVLDEAKILNKPIIITDTAAKEAIKDYKNSYILENDEKSIIKGLTKILQNNTNKENKTQKFDYNEYYENIIKQIKSIL